MTGNSAVYRFENMVLDLARGSLSRHGQEIPLRRLSFALLCLLVRNNGRLLDRDAINDAVWPDHVTSDENIAQCVRDVRQAIGDHGRSILRTVPRRGYIFTAVVAVSEPVPEAVRRRPRVPGPTIAIPSFQASVNGSDHGRAAEDLATEVSIALTRLTPVTVIVADAGAVSGDNRPISDEADYALTCRVRHSAGQAVVMVQLLERDTGAHVWAHRYIAVFSSLGDNFGDLGARIAADVRRQIDARVLSRARLVRQSESTPYELVLRGQEYLLSRRHLDTARSLFTQAIELDPCNAMAHAGMAHFAYSEITWRPSPVSPDTLGTGFRHAERALSLNDSLPAAHSALANLHLRADEHETALRWARNAIILNPHEAASYAKLANVLSYTGQSEEALVHLARARMLDPGYPALWDYYAGRALVHIGRYADALAWLNRACRRAPHVETWGGYRAAALAHLGRLAEIHDASPRLLLPRGFASIDLLVRHDSYQESRERDTLIDGFRMAGFPL